MNNTILYEPIQPLDFPPPVQVGEILTYDYIPYFSQVQQPAVDIQDLYNLGKMYSLVKEFEKKEKEQQSKIQEFKYLIKEAKITRTSPKPRARVEPTTLPRPAVEPAEPTTLPRPAVEPAEPTTLPRPAVEPAEPTTLPRPAEPTTLPRPAVEPAAPPTTLPRPPTTLPRPAATIQPAPPSPQTLLTPEKEFELRKLIVQLFQQYNTLVDIFNKLYESYKKLYGNIKSLPELKLDLKDLTGKPIEKIDPNTLEKISFPVNESNLITLVYLGENLLKMSKKLKTNIETLISADKSRELIQQASV
jgi:hypothetical protein